MSALTVPHEIQWVTAQPLWAGFSSEPELMRRPALLRFASDSFMDDLAALLEPETPDLTGYVAERRSYRPRPIGQPEPWEPALDRLKLYQSIHGDFYLVAAGLVCRMPGLPDHAVDTTAKEDVSFVLRRVGEAGELAWTVAPSGRSWQPVEGPLDTVAPGEDLLPMFPLGFTSGERKRRLLVGLVPTSSGETFKAGGKLSPLADESGQVADPRPQELSGRVTRPLQALLPTPRANQPSDADAIVPSQFVLVDLADFIRTNARTVFDALADPDLAAELRGAPLELFELLSENVVDQLDDASPTWRQALVTAWDEHDKILGEAVGAPTDVTVTRSTLEAVDLELAVLAALPDLPEGSPRVDGVAAADVAAPKITESVYPPKGRDVVYRIRCVYRRPECGALCPPVVSEPTEDFQIAGFFDPDAPARPIRITMPLDTKPQTLRKFNRNVGFMLSDELRKQMARVVDVQKLIKDKQVEDPEEGLDLGVICSFSLPIITIVALMLLMIMVGLLNIIFWWMPFFRICFPAPKLKAG